MIKTFDLTTEHGFLYRFVNHRVSVCVNPDYDEYSSRMEVSLEQFPIIKVTPQGYWIKLGWKKRWVKKDAHKKFACKTVEEAKESFIARKNRQILIHQNIINDAKKAISTLEFGIYNRYSYE